MEKIDQMYSKKPSTAERQCIAPTITFKRIRGSDDSRQCLVRVADNKEKASYVVNRDEAYTFNKELQEVLINHVVI